MLGIILDHLDELVEQVDNIDPGLTEKEIPLVGVSTKDIVAKIQSIKQTIDELRGSPLAEIDCIAERRTARTAQRFDLQATSPTARTVWCRADLDGGAGRGHVDREGDRRLGAATSQSVLLLCRAAAPGTSSRRSAPTRTARLRTTVCRSPVTDNDGTDPLTTIERVAGPGRVHGCGRESHGRVPELGAADLAAGSARS